MELIYLYIDKYKNIEKQGFHFSSKYNCKFKDDKLVVTKNKNHKDIVLDIIKRNVIYSDDYIDELMSKYEGTLFNSKDELIELIYCNYIDKKDINKRPLSKLASDMLEQIDG